MFRYSLIGAGMVAATHVDALANSKTCTLAGIWSRTDDSAQALAVQARQLGISDVHVFPDLESAIHGNGIDGIIVATPPSFRGSIIEEAVKSRVPVLLEKPVSRNFVEAAAISKACQSANLVAGVVFQHRMREASRAAKSLLESGEIGRVFLVEAGVPWWRDQAYYDEPGRGTYSRDGGGVLISQAIHTIDLLLDLVGDVDSVTAELGTSGFHVMEAEDFSVVGMRFLNGARGSLVASTAFYPGNAEYIRIFAEHASISLAGAELVVSWRDGRTETIGAETGSGGSADPMAFTSDWHRDVFENFAEAAINQTKPLVSVDVALKSHAFIEAAERASKHGRRVSMSEIQ